MDPYLEDPALWPDVHQRLIADIQTALNRTLRPKYFVRAELRVYLPDEDLRVAIPDVRVSEWDNGWPGGRNDANGGVATAVIDPYIVGTTYLESEIEESFLEIVSADDRRVVTILEVVSPGNKDKKSNAGRAYKAKRAEVLQSAVHWVELDLLRAGGRVGTWDFLPAHDYLIFVSAVGGRPKDRFWPFRLRDRMPTIGIPLLPEDPDAPLVLQAVLNAAYDNAAYDASIDYRKPPNPPLDAEQSTWANELLQKANRL